jgi:hypothetical protein
MDSSLECGPAGVEKGHFQIGEIAQMAGSALGQAERLYQTLSGGHCHIAEEEHKNFYASDIFYPTATASRHTFIAAAKSAFARAGLSALIHSQRKGARVGRSAPAGLRNNVRLENGARVLSLIRPADAQVR